jgi:hypothetical protein
LEIMPKVTSLNGSGTGVSESTIGGVFMGV